MKLSVLICTIPERKMLFEALKKKLFNQITDFSQVEILSYLDNKKITVGAKRNALVKMATGEYVCFIDDDDDVSDKYVDIILSSLKGEDCARLVGIITTSGRGERRFVHSIAYQSYYEQNGVYCRPPNHLNPIKKDIAMKIPFPDKNFGEDTDWAMAICKRGLIKT